MKAAGRLHPPHALCASCIPHVGLSNATSPAPPYRRTAPVPASLYCPPVLPPCTAPCTAATNQVLDEIGVDLSAALGTAPTRRIAAPAAATRAEEAEEGEDLAARLAALRS